MELLSEQEIWTIRALAIKLVKTDGSTFNLKYANVIYNDISYRVELILNSDHTYTLNSITRA